MILALQSLHFLYFTQPEVFLAWILSFCVIPEHCTHAAWIYTFLLSKSDLRITKLDGESRLPAVITHAREGWVPWGSQTDWTHGTR